MRSKLSNRGGVGELRSEEVGDGDRWGRVRRRGGQHERCALPFSQTGSTEGTGCEPKPMSSFLSPLPLRNQEDMQEGSVS